jgi:uncharacterized protein YjeT (DUF2065 family)
VIAGDGANLSHTRSYHAGRRLANPIAALADRDRSELATVVVRVAPRAAHELVRRLRELLEAALRLDGSGTEQVRLTLAVVPVTRPAKL